jgi:hypothetical protein
MAQKIDWSKCIGPPNEWPIVEQYNFEKLSLRSGKVFILSLTYFNEHLENNPAYINIESRSLISFHYQGFGKIAIILFNPKDIIMFNMLVGGNAKNKINDFDYVLPVTSNYPHHQQLIKWDCGTFTLHHPVINGILTNAKKKLCFPRFNKSSIFYSVKECPLTFEKFWNDDQYHKKWRSELGEVYKFDKIKKMIDRLGEIN